MENKIQVSEHDGHRLEYHDGPHRYFLNGKRKVGVTTFTKGGYPENFNLKRWKIGEGAKYAINWCVENLVHHFDCSGGIIQPSEKDIKEVVKASKDAWQKPAKEAADVGTLVHDFAYHFEHGHKKEFEAIYVKTNELDDGIKVRAGIEKFLAWKQENQDEILHTEEIVANICSFHLKNPEHKGECFCYCGKYDRLARRNNVVVLSDFKTSNGIYVDHFIQLAAYAIAIEYWQGIRVDALEILRFGKENAEELQTLLIDDMNEIAKFRAQAIRCRQTYEFSKIENDKRFKFGGGNVKRSAEVEV